MSNADDTYWDSVLPSAIAGFVSRVVCHPADTLKVEVFLALVWFDIEIEIVQSRIQAPAIPTAEFKNVFTAARTTISEEGLRGLYR